MSDPEHDSRQILVRSSSEVDPSPIHSRQNHLRPKTTVLRVPNSEASTSSNPLRPQSALASVTVPPRPGDVNRLQTNLTTLDNMKSVSLELRRQTHEKNYFEDLADNAQPQRSASTETVEVEADSAWLQDLPGSSLPGQVAVEELNSALDVNKNTVDGLLPPRTTAWLKFLGLIPLSHASPFVRHSLTVTWLSLACLSLYRGMVLTVARPADNVGAEVSAFWGLACFVLTYVYLNLSRHLHSCVLLAKYMGNTLLDSVDVIKVGTTESTPGARGTDISLMHNRRVRLAHQLEALQEQAFLTYMIRLPTLVWVVFGISYTFAFAEDRADVDPAGVYSALGKPAYIILCQVVVYPILVAFAAPWWIFTSLVEMHKFIHDEHTFWFVKHARYYQTTLKRHFDEHTPASVKAEASERRRAISTFWSVRHTQVKAVKKLHWSIVFRFPLAGQVIGCVVVVFWFLSGSLLQLASGAQHDRNPAVALASGCALSVVLFSCARSMGTYFYIIRRQAFSEVRMKQLTVPDDEAATGPTHHEEIETSRQKINGFFSVQSSIDIDLTKSDVPVDRIPHTSRNIVHVLLAVWGRAGWAVGVGVAIMCLRVMAGDPRCSVQDHRAVFPVLTNCPLPARLGSQILPMIQMNITLPLLLLYLYSRLVPPRLMPRRVYLVCFLVIVCCLIARLLFVLRLDYSADKASLFGQPAWIFTASISSYSTGVIANTPKFWKVCFGIIATLLLSFGTLSYVVVPAFVQGSASTHLVVILAVVPAISFITRRVYWELVLALLEFSFVSKYAFTVWVILQVGLATYYRMFLLATSTLSIQVLAILYFAATEVFIRTSEPLQKMIIGRVYYQSTVVQALEKAAARSRSRLHASLAGINTLIEFQVIVLTFLVFIIMRLFYDEYVRGVERLVVLVVMQLVAEFVSDFVATTYDLHLLQRNYLQLWMTHRKLFGQIVLVATIIAMIPVATVARISTLELNT